MQGQIERGLSLIHEGFALWKSRGVELAHTWFSIIFAEAYLKAGDRTAGLQAVSEAFERMEEVQERVWEAELWRLKGELLLLNDADRTRHDEFCSLASNPQEEAEGCFHSAIDVARRQHAKSLELRAATSLARSVAAARQDFRRPRAARPCV